MEKNVTLMLGNEAIARGAYEAGCAAVASYPGTPSTEITEFAAKYGEMNVEWSVNEKVAMEIAAGVSYGGGRALTCMKHVGMNVAADPMFTLAYTGVNGGLVVVVADDPGIHSSQNEQDSRFYARAAHIPMLVPSDSRECLEFTKLAFELSEKWDTPVIVGTCTRIAHARSLVPVGEREPREVLPIAKNPAKYVMLPGPARNRHKYVEERETKLADEACSCSVKSLESLESFAYRVENGGDIGVVCSGTAYQYVKEVMPNASVMKLHMVHPLPINAIREFAKNVKDLIVIEELEPFIEDAIKAAGIPCHGKELTGRQGELSVNRLREIMGVKSVESVPNHDEPPARPPVMCPGCPHRAVFHTLNKGKYYVTGDIGCYTLGMMPPHKAIDACLCMGASIGMAMGIEKARGVDDTRRQVAVIGDSTFMHSGMTALLDAVYNKSRITLLILDNRITGMTGHQHNPASGFDIHGQPTDALNIEALVRALGVKRVQTVDPFDLKALEEALDIETQTREVSVIICQRPCALIVKPDKPLGITDCKGCKACLAIGCPAMSIGGDGRSVTIERSLCTGCGLCVKLCRFGCINPAKDGTLS